jgi:serine/threonine protein kinase
MLFVIIGLFTTLCCLFIIIGLFAVFRLRKKHHQYRLAHLEIPDFGTNRPVISLEQLLQDQTIPRIPFEQLEITKRLGMGAAGVVHQAKWSPDLPKEPRDVAIKELILSVEDLDECSLQDFIMEIKLMSALRDPNVVEFMGHVSR